MKKDKQNRGVYSLLLNDLINEMSVKDLGLHLDTNIKLYVAKKIFVHNCNFEKAAAAMNVVEDYMPTILRKYGLGYRTLLRKCNLKVEQ